MISRRRKRASIFGAFPARVGGSCSFRAGRSRRRSVIAATLLILSWPVHAEIVDLKLISVKNFSNQGGPSETFAFLTGPGTDMSSCSPAPCTANAEVNDTSTWQFDTGTGVVTQTGGTYAATLRVGGIVTNLGIVRHEATNLAFGGNLTASATSFQCADGPFPGTLSWSFCGNYSFGTNTIDDSTHAYGTIGNQVTIGGDDVSGGNPSSVNEVFDGMATTYWDGHTLVVANGQFGDHGKYELTFHVIKKLVLTEVRTYSTTGGASDPVMFLHGPGTAMPSCAPAPCSTDQVNDSSVWEYDLATDVVTQTSGIYRATLRFGAIEAGTAMFQHQATGLVVGGGPASVASATTWECYEGPFGAGVGGHLCGNYNFGGNFTDDSTFTHTGTGGNVVIGGDDTVSGPPQDVNNRYDGMETRSWDGQTLVVANADFGDSSGFRFTFEVPVEVTLQDARRWFDPGGGSQEQLFFRSGPATDIGAGEVPDTSTWLYSLTNDIVTQDGGTYAATLRTGNTEGGTPMYQHQGVDVSVGNGDEATATSFICEEGAFGALIGAHLCGGYNFGTNSIDESSFVQGQTAGIVTLGGDDVYVSSLRASTSRSMEWTRRPGTVKPW